MKISSTRWGVWRCTMARCWAFCSTYAGKIAEITGIDRKEVDKAFAELKKEGAIVSPVRCKWEPTK
ncbi:MAG: hypothetical protein IKZ51_08080 [Bacteroidales bacterium]|nr:hypothetical protein [Bacteroidales bacterium]